MKFYLPSHLFRQALLSREHHGCSDQCHRKRPLHGSPVLVLVTPSSGALGHVQRSARSCQQFCLQLLDEGSNRAGCLTAETEILKVFGLISILTITD